MHRPVYSTTTDIGTLSEAGAVAIIGELGRSTAPTTETPAGLYGLSDHQGPDAAWYAVLRPGDGGDVTLVRSLREALRTLLAPVGVRDVELRAMARLARTLGHVAHVTPSGVLLRGYTDHWEVYPDDGSAWERALRLDSESLLGPHIP